MNSTETIITRNRFDFGFDLYRNGEHFRRVPSCTYYDDDAYRLVNRDGTLILQREERIVRGNRSWSTDEWVDHRDLGSIEGVSVEFDDGLIEVLG
jgi:hypothetical protein